MKGLVRYITEKISGGVTFNDIFKVKNKWVDVAGKNKMKLMKEFFSLVNVSYQPIGGHIKIQKPEDILNEDWDKWIAIDFDQDPNTEIVIFGKKTKYGIKWSGVGHDGTRESKRKYIGYKIEKHKKPGNFTEVSERLADILLENNVTFLNNKEDVEKVLGKTVEWVEKSTEGHKGTGWYKRKIGGRYIEKIIVGIPKSIPKSSLSTV